MLHPDVGGLPRSLAGGSKADGMISKPGHAQERRNGAQHLSAVPVPCPIKAARYAGHWPGVSAGPYASSGDEDLGGSQGTQRV